MLRNRLKEIDLRITELADYLQISRPTMYKFIDYYDENNFDLINKKVLKLFNYIKENELAGKKNVINYILSNLVDLKELGNKEEINQIKNIKQYIISNPESKKSKFFEICSKKDIYDEIIYYLVDIKNLINKRKLTEEEQSFLEPYTEFISKIKSTKEKGDY
ncbi:MAG: hypothetical protein IJB10_03355 [Clostridia bacterium]|nr:hypothetical protein [Clostridia bacterium]